MRPLDKLNFRKPGLNPVQVLLRVSLCDSCTSRCNRILPGLFILMQQRILSLLRIPLASPSFRSIFLSFTIYEQLTEKNTTSEKLSIFCLTKSDQRGKRNDCIWKNCPLTKIQKEYVQPEARGGSMAARKQGKDARNTFQNQQTKKDRKQRWIKRKDEKESKQEKKEKKDNYGRLQYKEKGRQKKDK